MKYVMLILAAVLAVVGVLFAVFKLTAGKPKAATSTSQALGPAPQLPASATATDKSAQRIGAVADLVGAASGLLGGLGIGRA